MAPMDTPETQPWPSAGGGLDHVRAYLEFDDRGLSTLTVRFSDAYGEPNRVIINGEVYDKAEVEE